MKDPVNRYIKSSIAGFPKCIYTGVEGLENVLVMELLGSNLDDLHCYCNERFSLKTTLMLADQMVLI